GDGEPRPRPGLEAQRCKILTLGVKATGKTSLTVLCGVPRALRHPLEERMFAYGAKVLKKRSRVVYLRVNLRGLGPCHERPAPRQSACPLGSTCSGHRPHTHTGAVCAKRVALS